MNILNTCSKLFAGIILICSVQVTAFAQSATKNTKLVKPHTASKKDSVTLALSLAPNVVDSVKMEGDTDKKGYLRPLHVDFNTRIVLYLSGPSKRFENSDSVAIYINNQKMPYKVTFNCPCLDTTKNHKKFTLTCTLGKHDTSWNKLYGFKNDYLEVKVDAGTLSKQLTCTTSNNLAIKMFNKDALTFAWVVAILILVAAIALAFWPGCQLLRDHSEAPVKKPYSLSRFQLFWWSIIVIISFILLFAIRDDFSLLSKSTLILIGISAAGTGFAAVIDYSDADRVRHQDQEGKGFIIDVLSDNDGVSVHRLQNLLFTLIFGIIFIYKVLNTGNMPEFGELELTLMGLSTATYVGLKTGENKTQDQKTDSTGVDISSDPDITG